MAHKLSVTIGGNKVELEGDPRDLAERFDRLTEMLAASTNGDQKRPTQTSEESPKSDRGEPIQEEPFSDLNRDPNFTDAIVEVFDISDDGSLSLLGPWPAMAPDRALLLLYGFWALAGERPSTAPAFGKALRRSGVDKIRLDRLLAAHARHYETRGQRRGKRYAITAEGVDYCEDLLSNKEAESVTAEDATSAAQDRLKSEAPL